MLKKSKVISEISDKKLSLSLSLEKFQDLFKKEDEEKLSSLKYLLSSVVYNGLIENNAILMNAKFTLESFVDEYQVLDLVPRASVIKNTKIPKDIKFGLFNNTYHFLVNKKGKFEIEYSVYIPFSSKNANNSFSFDSISGGKLNLLLPLKNALVSIKNIDDISYENKENETLVKTDISFGAVEISWRDKQVEKPVVKKELKPKETKAIVEPIIYSEIKTSISVSETIIQCSSNIDYKVYKAGVDSFDLEIEDGKIVNIEGSFVKNYDIENKDKLNKITVYTDRVIYDDFNFNISYEKDVELESEETKKDKLISVPVIKSKNINRETGVISLSSTTNIELSVLKHDKLIKTDISELPSDFKTDLLLGSLFAYKYFSSPYKLDITITKHKELPVVVAMADYMMVTTVLLKEGKLLNQLDLRVRNNSQTFVKFFLPNASIPLSATVNHSSVKPVKGDDNSIMIPIDKSSDGEKLFNIKFLFNIEVDKVKKEGSTEIRLGSLEIPIKKLYWQLYLPESHKYKKFKGNLEKVNGFSYDQNISPQDVTIPKLGNIFRFEDYFLNSEEVSLKFKYNEIFKLFKSNDVKPL